MGVFVFFRRETGGIGAVIHDLWSEKEKDIYITSVAVKELITTRSERL